VIQRKVLALTNIREPLWKLCTLGILRINTHVFGETEDIDMMLQKRSMNVCTNNLFLVAFENHKQGLLEIPSYQITYHVICPQGSTQPILYYMLKHYVIPNLVNATESRCYMKNK